MRRRTDTVTDMDIADVVMGTVIKVTDTVTASAISEAATLACASVAASPREHAQPRDDWMSDD